MCPGSRAHHTEEGLDCRQVSFCWSPSWLGSRVLNPEVCDNRTRRGCPESPVDVSLGNQLPDPLVQGQERSSCSFVRGWPPWERQPSPGGRLLSHCSPCPVSPLWGHLQRTGQCDPRETKREDKVAVTCRRPGAGGACWSRAWHRWGQPSHGLWVGLQARPFSLGLFPHL